MCPQSGAEWDISVDTQVNFISNSLTSENEIFIFLKYNKILDIISKDVKRTKIH